MGLMRNLAGFVAATVLSMGTAFADDWSPNGTLKLQIAFGAGGSTDTMGRVLAQVIKEQTGWSIIAENKTGGGGVAMMTGIANMPARGLVMGIGVNEPILVNLAQRGDELAFDLDSFDYVGTVARGQLSIVASADAPFSDLAGVVQHVKDNGPIAIPYSAAGQRALFEVVAKAEGIDFKFVTSKGGAELLKLLLGGQVQAAFGSGEELRYLESGDMKVLASVGPERLSHTPDALTFIESGYDVFIDPVWYIATTAGTDPAALDALRAAVDAAIKDPRVVEIVQNMTKADPINLGAEGTREMMVGGMAVAEKLAGK
ncbi:tripartite tricarboxylate transporter substrate binding protein [Phaeobacter sp. J2-8]|uniref:tripartite tricarboxylate transporter substrate binding protein n=1 Tax=Phaeobacter sp. J2-8 TaxID=2931394 RepID=UPI001FD37282|nr:tripartite tricarboxylate transporter substrate binding protein [Phaeobacter sp. J2-8]MCJ7871286.1 tripartite tricarboxylate transporter substrate binding protein [Phaeobacter sp. J2-8]